MLTIPVGGSLGNRVEHWGVQWTATPIFWPDEVVPLGFHESELFSCSV